MIEHPPFTPIDKNDSELTLTSEQLDKIRHINNEYMYWSDVKYRAKDSGLSAESLWQQTKKVRAKHDIIVWPEFNLHFSLTDNHGRSNFLKSDGRGFHHEGGGERNAPAEKEAARPITADDS